MSGTALPAGSTSGGTQTAAAGTGATLTLAAPGAGLFIYITYIEITKTASALLVVAATPVLVTTTNIPGTPTIDFPADAAAQGTQVVRQIAPGVPIKSVTANTAVTIVAPATTSIVWRVTAHYFIGP